jgi:hypothetical protein
VGGNAGVNPLLGGVTPIPQLRFAFLEGGGRGGVSLLTHLTLEQLTEGDH